MCALVDGKEGIVEMENPRFRWWNLKGEKCTFLT
jgi:hypothetical protein